MPVLKQDKRPWTKKLKVGGTLTDTVFKHSEVSAPNSFPLLFLEKWRPDWPPFFYPH